MVCSAGMMLCALRILIRKSFVACFARKTERNIDLWTADVHARLRKKSHMKQCTCNQWSSRYMWKMSVHACAHFRLDPNYYLLYRVQSAYTGFPYVRDNILWLLVLCLIAKDFSWEMINSLITNCRFSKMQIFLYTPI